MELIIANTLYVLYRLTISSTLVTQISKYVSYFSAVLIMSQISFFIDSILFGVYFNATAVPTFYSYVTTDITYTIRVVAAWWLIKKIWKIVGNFYVAVFIGSEITFIIDFYLLHNMLI